MPIQRKPLDARVDPERFIPARVLDYSDSAFTVVHQVVKLEEPVFDPDAFTLMGKEMDGCESRRHRSVEALPDRAAFRYDPRAHNFIRIGFLRRSRVDRLELSTEWFTGNQVQWARVYLTDELTGDRHLILDRTRLEPDAKHFFEVEPRDGTELYVECYPDGGMARVRCYGERSAQPLPQRVDLLDGATVSHASNVHYGTPEDAVAGRREVEFMRGWESGRAGFGERVLFTRGEAAEVHEVVVDTYRHLLNAPPRFYLFGSRAEGSSDDLMRHAPRWEVAGEGKTVAPDDLRNYIQTRGYLSDFGEAPFEIRLANDDAGPWLPILVHEELRPDAYHRFTSLQNEGPFDRLLVMHFPNGGIHGLRVLGAPVEETEA